MMCYNMLKHKIMVRSSLAKWSHEKEKLERDFQKQLQEIKHFLKIKLNVGF